jgi:hypothetical protein
MGNEGSSKESNAVFRVAVAARQRFRRTRFEIREALRFEWRARRPHGLRQRQKNRKSSETQRFSLELHKRHRLRNAELDR